MELPSEHLERELAELAFDKKGFSYMCRKDIGAEQAE